MKSKNENTCYYSATDNPFSDFFFLSRDCFYLNLIILLVLYSAKVKAEFEKYLVAAAEIHVVHKATPAHDALCAQDAFL